MRKIKTIDHITKSGKLDLGEDYVIVEDINDAEGIIIRSSSMHEMELPRGVAAVARAGAGFNNIPIDRFARQGVVVFNTPGANSNAVKELMVCLFLLASRDVLGGIKWCRDHEEDPDAYVHAEAAKKAFVGWEIKGKTAGVVGLGNVGSKVANALVDLGMTVYGYDPYIAVKDAWQLSRDVIRLDDLNDLCSRCDYVTVHVPSEPDTWGLIGAEQIDVHERRRDAVQLLPRDPGRRGRRGRRPAQRQGPHVPDRLRHPRRAQDAQHDRDAPRRRRHGGGRGELRGHGRRAAAGLPGERQHHQLGQLPRGPHGRLPRRGPRGRPARQRAEHDRPDHRRAGRPGRQHHPHGQREPGGHAYTLFDVNEPVAPETVAALEAIEGMWRVRVVK